MRHTASWESISSPQSDPRSTPALLTSAHVPYLGGAVHDLKLPHELLPLRLSITGHDIATRKAHSWLAKAPGLIVEGGP